MNCGPDIEVLLVEDNPADAEMALRVLSNDSVRNRTAVVCDGEEALDFLFARGFFADRRTARKPKVVLLDLRLPRVDGLEVLRAIRADPSTNLLPVVVLTSSGQEDDLVESYRLGVNSYVVKPVAYEEYVATLKDLGLYWLSLNEPPSR